MKIERLEILKVPPSWVWLKVHASDGTYGLGEPYLEGHPEAVIAEVRRLEPRLVGRDPRRIEELWLEMYEGGTGYKGGPVTMSAISGIDMALWDLAGKVAGLPIWQMLGGRCRERVKVYRAVSAGPPWCVAPGQPYRAGRPADLAVQVDDPAAYAKVALHCPLSPLAFAASVQLDACLPNFLVQEHNEVNDWREGGRTYIGRGYLKEPFVLDQEGCVAVPEGPGLGVEVDEAGMREVMAQPWSERRG